MATASYMRGINLMGGEFGSLPGTYLTDYMYPSQVQFNNMYSFGHRLIRLPFKMERIQPVLGGALSSTEVTRLKDAIDRAGIAGLKVVVEPHNYARYQSGSSTYVLGDGNFTQAHLADFWSRLSAALKGNVNLWAYGLMNEPYDIPAAAGTYVGTTVYNFDTTAQGWGGDSCTVARNTATIYEGAGSLQVTPTALAANTPNSAFIANDSNNNTMVPANGKTLRTRVFLPVGSAGSNWRAKILLQNGSYAYQNGPEKALVAGSWTDIDYTPSDALWANHKAVAVQFLVDTSATLTPATIYIDSLTQGTFSGNLTSAKVWEAAAQASVTAIRNNADNLKIAVPGYQFQSARFWTDNHPTAWVSDPAANLVYEAHYYPDATNAGQTPGGAFSYASAVADATARGYPSLAAKVTDELNNFTDWCASQNVQGFIGEVGWPNAAADTASWNAIGEVIYSLLDTTGLSATYWASSAYGDYDLAAYQGTNLDVKMPPASVIEAHRTLGGSTSTMATLSQRLLDVIGSIGADIKTLTAAIANKANKGELVKNVVDYGADKTGANLSATFTGVTAALAACAEGGTVYFPEGVFRWNGDVVVLKNRITFTGPGIIDGKFSVGDGTVRYITDTAFASLRFVRPLDKVTYTVKGYADNSYFIKNDRNRQIRVQECEFYGAAYPVYVPPTVANSHDNSMLRIKNNFFNECDWAVYTDIASSQVLATYYENVADSQIIGNIINKSYVGGFYHKGVDGVEIDQNVFFMQNFNNQGGRAAEKKQNIRIDLCNWAHIHDNNLFESGTESILIGGAKNYTITGNLIAWEGQQAMSDAISVTAASPTYGGEWSSGVISGNNIQFYTKSAIAVKGNHVELLLGPNAVRYSASAESYKGAGGLTALAAAAHYRYDLSALTGMKMIDVGIIDPVSTRDGQSDLFAGHPYVQGIRRQELYGIMGSSFRGAVTFTAGQSISLAALRDAADGSGTYSGQIRVIAKNGVSSASKMAYYVMYVTKTASGTSELVQVTAQGLDNGTAVDDPSFTWTIDSTTNQLIAKAVGSTAGAFNFTIFFNDNVIVG